MCIFYPASAYWMQMKIQARDYKVTLTGFEVGSQQKNNNNSFCIFAALYNMTHQTKNFKQHSWVHRLYMYSWSFSVLTNLIYRIHDHIGYTMHHTKTITNLTTWTWIASVTVIIVKAVRPRGADIFCCWPYLENRHASCIYCII